MPEFAYKAFTTDGRMEQGALRAPDEANALVQLAGRGLTPFDVTAREDVQTAWWAREVTLLRDAMPRTELAAFLRAFAMLLEARIPVPEALALAIEDVEHGRLKRQLRATHAALIEGARLGKALEQSAPLVPTEVTAMLAIGETGNRLATVAERVATLAERDVALRNELRSALTYPLLLLIASVAVIALLVFLVVPSLAPVFVAVRSEPPWSIAALMSLRDGVQAWWPIGLAGGIILLGLLTLIGRRAGSHDLFYRLPVLGRIRASAEASRALGALGLMLEAQIDLPEALRLTAGSTARRVLSQDLTNAATAVETGASLVVALGDSPSLPSLARQMLKVGVEANRLPEMLGHVAQVLDSRTREALKRVLGLLTPTLTLIIGLLIGVLIYSTLTSILDLNDLAFQ